MGRTSIVMEYSYYSTAQSLVVATAEAVVVRLDSAGKDKLSWSSAERERLLALEATVGHTPEV